MNDTSYTIYNLEGDEAVWQSDMEMRMEFSPVPDDARFEPPAVDN